MLMCLGIGVRYLISTADPFPRSLSTIPNSKRLNLTRYYHMNYADLIILRLKCHIIQFQRLKTISGSPHSRQLARTRNQVETPTT